MEAGRVDEVKNLLSDLEPSAEKIEEHGKRADAIVHSMLLRAKGGTGERQSTDLKSILEESLNLAYHSYQILPNSL